MDSFEKFEDRIDGLLVGIAGESWKDYPRPVDLHYAYHNGYSTIECVAAALGLSFGQTLSLIDSLE